MSLQNLPSKDLWGLLFSHCMTKGRFLPLLCAVGIWLGGRPDGCNNLCFIFHNYSHFAKRILRGSSSFHKTPREPTHKMTLQSIKQNHNGQASSHCTCRKTLPRRFKLTAFCSRATGRVNKEQSPKMVAARINSFHAVLKEKRAVAAIASPAKGRIRYQNIVNRFAPSITAASSISTGREPNTLWASTCKSKEQCHNRQGKAPGVCRANYKNPKWYKEVRAAPHHGPESAGTKVSVK